MKRIIEMYIPKRYGQSKVNKCPFCGRDAFSQNSQKIPVCKDHKDTMMKDMKCACGSWLDMREGKFGVFYTCLNCGPVNMNKALEVNNPMENSLYKVQKKTQTKVSETKQEERREENRREEGIKMSRKTKAIRAMGKEQMLERIVELRKQLLKFNSQIAVGTIPESPGKVKQLKKEIARILTIMNEPLKAKASVAPKGAAVKEKTKHVGAGKAK